MSHRPQTEADPHGAENCLRAVRQKHHRDSLETHWNDCPVIPLHLTQKGQQPPRAASLLDTGG
jgi:hypothetical protein